MQPSDQAAVSAEVESLLQHMEAGGGDLIQAVRNCQVSPLGQHLNTYGCSRQHRGVSSLLLVSLCIIRLPGGLVYHF